MEEKKYYTPKIEDFHVGFEFEYKVTGEKGWVKTLLKDEDLEAEDPGGWGWDSTIAFYHRLLRDNNVRVKHLDKEDIESLGFIYRRIVNDIYEEYTPIEYNTLPSTGNIILRNTKSNEVICFKKLNNKFEGNIKNKSELKKVLKMIEI